MELKRPTPTEVDWMSPAEKDALIGDQYGMQPSGGMVQKWVLRVARRLAPTHEANRRTILKSGLVHFDESGLRVNGQLHWLDVAATHAAVYGHVHAKRGRNVMDAAGIPPPAQGSRGA